MTWKCAAIDHGVTIFPNGKIGPCCKIKADYLKPISDLTNADRFADLKTEYPPSACESCISDECNNLPSYRHQFNNLKTSAAGLQFVDIRNTNLCNLKCRYCGPHFSSQWAKELGNIQPIVRQDLTHWKSTLITDSLHWMYFTGGEPLISDDHWSILQELVKTNQASKISLMYNSNLTVTRYKNIDIQDLWKKFRSVRINCSIDAVGQPLEYIRSGTQWQQIDHNIQVLKQFKNIQLTLTPVLSILNFWFLPDFVTYAAQQQLALSPIVLNGPDYLALDVIPDQLKPQALNILNKVESSFNPDLVTVLRSKIENNINQVLFSHTINHILFLDNHRNEKLFDLLPFKSVVTDLFIKNYEYE
jgi:sulfatase maturation enzyme AslB (radical SAM superfamily)